MPKTDNDLIGALMAKALENIDDEDLRQSIIDEARMKLEQPVKIGMSPGGSYHSDEPVMVPGYIAVIWQKIAEDVSKQMRDAISAAIPAAAQAAVKSVVESEKSMAEISKRIGDGALEAIAKETADRLGDTIGDNVGYAMAQAIQQAFANMQLR